MAPRKKSKTDEISGSHIRYEERQNTYRYKDMYVNFGTGESRIYDISEAFLHKDVIFQVLSEVHKVITVGNPRSRVGGILGKGIQLSWILNRFDRHFSKNTNEISMNNLVKRLSMKCDSECLWGIVYRNKFMDPVTVHMDGSSLGEICKIMNQTPRPFYKEACDILNKKYRGHRSNGDSVIKVKSISPDDLPIYMLLVRERILRAQKLDGQEYLITSEVDSSEESLVKSLHELSRRYDLPFKSIQNNPEDSVKEELIEEQLQACEISLNSPVSYLCGGPGVGKTSGITKIIEESKNTMILTPSHVAKSVVQQRAVKNGIDENTYSVEVLAFAVRHIQEWMPDNVPEGVHEISQRSKDFMQKFKGDDGSLQIETLLIEEASMIDIFSASRVIEQFCDIPSLKRIIFVGDHRQLPSVAKGRVLQDVMECGSIKGKVLETNHRSGSALSSNLKHILASNMLHMEEDDSFEVTSVPLGHCEVETDPYGRDRVMALQPVIDMYMGHLKNGDLAHIFGYTHVEVNHLNEALKASIFGSGTVMFPDGCKVRVKDPDLITPSYFHRNDFLRVTSNKGPKHFVVKRWNNQQTGDEDTDDEEEEYEIKVNGKLKEALTLGYASSIHAFQGSECPVVIVHAIPKAAYFSRDALYTSCSRGKKKCCVITCSQARHNWKKICYRRAVVRLSNLSRRL